MNLVHGNKTDRFTDVELGDQNPERLNVTQEVIAYVMQTAVRVSPGGATLQPVLRNNVSVKEWHIGFLYAKQRLIDPGANQRLHDERPATNDLNHGKAFRI
jgi:hypothetical protein